MKTIYKYSLEITDIQTIQLTVGAKLLSVQSQNNNPVLWALIDTEEKPDFCVIHMVGTGHNVKSPVEKLPYLNTFQIHEGKLVFHVFYNI